MLPVVHRTPDWAAARPGDGAAAAPRGTAAYTSFLAALVGRYGPNGSLWAEQPALPKLPIRDWQIWNEPNLTRYWTPQPFARALREAAARLAPRAAARRPGLAHDPRRLAERELDRAAQGLRGRRARGFDAVALHPYTGRPRNVIRLIEFARREMRRSATGASRCG